MSDFDRKILWALDVHTEKSEERLFGHADAAGCNVVCVRTPSKRLPGLIPRAHARHLQVYAWRWPAVRPQPRSRTHYFADDEAAFVANKLVPAGLDGYIVDPESDSAGAVNDWNDKTHIRLAERFCKSIRDAAKGTPSFRFGTTSGCSYPKPNNRPNIPWAAFNAASDVLLPQSYWRVMTNKGPRRANGGTPAVAVRNGFDAWGLIPHHAQIVPMAGELQLVETDEIAAYAAAMKAAGVREFHIYIDGVDTSAKKLAAIRAL
jgi:hypothetical protein